LIDLKVIRHFTSTGGYTIVMLFAPKALHLGAAFVTDFTIIVEGTIFALILP
jgi:hypothetical protein